MIVIVCLETPSPGRASRAALDLACTFAAPASIIALSAGGPVPNAAVDLARSRAAVGRIVHVQSSTLDQTDFLTMGMVLAEAVRHLEGNLVLTGDRSDIEGQGLVPAALAHHLRVPLLSRVQAIRTGAPADSVEVTVRSGGRLCKLACPLPLVLSTSPETIAPPAAETSEARTVEVLPLPQLGLDASRLVSRPDLLGELVPAPAEKVRRLSLAEAASALLRHV